MTKVAAPLTIEGDDMKIIIKSRGEGYYKVTLAKVWPCKPFKLNKDSTICRQYNIRREILSMIENYMTNEDEIRQMVDEALEEAEEKFEEVERQ